HARKAPPTAIDATTKTSPARSSRPHMTVPSVEQIPDDAERERALRKRRAGIAVDLVDRARHHLVEDVREIHEHAGILEIGAKPRVPGRERRSLDEPVPWPGGAHGRLELERQIPLE